VRGKYPGVVPAFVRRIVSATFSATGAYGKATVSLGFDPDKHATGKTISVAKPLGVLSMPRCPDRYEHEPKLIVGEVQTANHPYAQKAQVLEMNVASKPCLAGLDIVKVGVNYRSATGEKASGLAFVVTWTYGVLELVHKAEVPLSGCDLHKFEEQTLRNSKTGLKSHGYLSYICVSLRKKSVLPPSIDYLVTAKLQATGQNGYFTIQTLPYPGGLASFKPVGFQAVASHRVDLQVGMCNYKIATKYQFDHESIAFNIRLDRSGLMRAASCWVICSFRRSGLPFRTTPGRGSRCSP
jgi:hypothetical protein